MVSRAMQCQGFSVYVLGEVNIVEHSREKERRSAESKIIQAADAYPREKESCFDCCGVFLGCVLT